MSRRSSMTKIREILRLLALQQLSHRQIAKSVRCSHNTVINIEQRAKEANIPCPLPSSLLFQMIN